MKTTITLLTAFFTVSTLQSQDFWERTNSPGYQVPTIAINSSGHLFAGIAGFGMFRSEDDGDTWTPINEGLTMPQIMKLAIDQVSGRIFASAFNLTGSQRGVFRSTDNGNSWKGISSLMNRGIYSLAINSSGHIFAGAFAGVVGGVLRSTDGGDTWTGTTLTSFVSNLAINSRGDIFACFTRFLYRSTDNGDSWSHVGPDSSSGLHCTGVAFGVNGDVFLTQHEPGELGWYGMMYRSTNNGDTWSVVRPLTLGGFGPLVVNANGHIFSGALCPSQSCVIRSSDNGTTWGDVGPGLPASYGVSTLVLNARGRIFASAGIAVYRSRLSTTSTKDEDAESPTAFALEQNYPNPFNPSTRIPFSVQVSGFTSLKVYDVLGREIRTLVDENLPAGSYEVTFNAEGLASGTYFYRLQAGEFVQTKRLLLLR